MSNFFEGISTTDSAGKGNSSSFFTDGTYRCIVNVFKAWPSENPKRAGQPMVCIEVNVLEVLQATEGSLQVGRGAKVIETLERALNGSLTPKGENAMGRVKQFVEEVLGGTSECGDITGEIVEALTEGDGQSIKGIVIDAQAETIHFENGGEWTKVTWFNVPE
tara:strand:+ start:2232 stop:2720 length:489 start_codon:yes stop_codon:yes gene_type:complete